MRVSQKTEIINAALKKAFNLERCGEYQKAYNLLKGFLDKSGCSLNLNKVPKKFHAELCLRFGAVYGHFGSVNAVLNSQSLSKDLLSRARSLFLNNGDEEKVSECETYLASAYVRQSEFGEADAWLCQSLSRNINPKGYVRLYTYIISSINYLQKREFSRLCKWLPELEQHYLEFGDSFLLGNFYNNLALAEKDSIPTKNTLAYFEKARSYFWDIQNLHFVGCVENNIALYYKNQKDFNNAHKAIDSASIIFESVGDLSRKAFCYDTKAEIYLDEKNFESALFSIDKVVSFFRSKDNNFFLVESLLSKIKIQIKVGKLAEAGLTFIEAAEICGKFSGEEALLNLSKEFTSLIRDNGSKHLKIYSESGCSNSSDSISLLFPDFLSVEGDFEAVLIESDSLANYGLCEGSYGVIDRNEQVKKGDLVGAVEDDTSVISLGFYDEDLGICCLEKYDNNPYFFSRSEAKEILKIVGYGILEKTSDGIDCVRVYPLKNLP